MPERRTGLRRLAKIRGNLLDERVAFDGLNQRRCGGEFGRALFTLVLEQKNSALGSTTQNVKQPISVPIDDVWRSETIFDHDGFAVSFDGRIRFRKTRFLGCPFIQPQEQFAAVIISQH